MIVANFTPYRYVKQPNFSRLEKWCFDGKSTVHTLCTEIVVLNDISFYANQMLPQPVGLIKVIISAI